MMCSPRSTGETRRLATWLVVSAVVVASCSGGDDAETGSTSTASPTSVAAPTGTAPATSEPRDTTIAPTTAAPVSTTTTAPPNPAPPTTTAPVGPPSTELLLPGDDGFFDALGTAAFVMEGATVEGTTTAFLGMDGVGYQTWLTDRGEVITWLYDGQLFREVDGLLEPTLFSGGLFPLILDAEIGFPVDDEFTALAPAGDEIDLDGVPGREFVAAPEDVLEHQRADHPEWWEWEAAQLEIVGNHGGAIVSYRETSQYTVIAPSNMLDPPPPRDIDEVWTATFEPTDAIPEFPADRVHPEADDILARQLVDRATSVHSRAVEQIFFADPVGEPEDARPVAVDDLNLYADSLLPERFGLSFGSIEESGGAVIGYEDNTLVIESASGTWFCQLGRPNAGPTLETPITGSADSAQAASEACRSQRS